MMNILPHLHIGLLRKDILHQEEVFLIIKFIK
jgi:hypothetical protein